MQGRMWVGDQSPLLSHVPHALYITLASACMAVVVLYLVIISGATYEFLPGDNNC